MMDSFEEVFRPIQDRAPSQYSVSRTNPKERGPAICWGWTPRLSLRWVQPVGVLKFSPDRRGRPEQQALREDSFPCASLGRCPTFCGDPKQGLGQTTIDDRRGYPQN